MRKFFSVLLSCFMIAGLFGCTSAPKDEVVVEEEDVVEETKVEKEELVVDVDYSFGSILFNSISNYDYSAIANIMEDIGFEMFEAKCKAFEMKNGDYMIPESEGSANYAGISFINDTFTVGYSINRDLESYAINNEIYLGDAYAYITSEDGVVFGLTKDGKNYLTGEEVEPIGTGSTGENIYNIRHM